MRSKHIQDSYTRMTKKVYLEGVKQRLINDVGTYFKAIDSEASSGNLVGFWGSARLLFPVIEAVAKTIYRKSGGKDERVAKLLIQLNIPYPQVVWQMYRHSLAHSDHLVHIKGSKRDISWSITASAGGVSTGHFFREGYVHIDTRRLYEDLVSFLQEEIDKSNTSIYVKTGIKVSRRYKGGLQEEIQAFP